MEKIISIILSFILSIFGLSADEEKKPVYDSGENSLFVYFIDVGQGDSILIKTPENKSILIDAGERGYGEKVCAFLRQKDVKKLDAVIGTHPHTDHIGGLSEVIKNFEADKIYMPRAGSDSATFENLLLEIAAQGKKVHTAEAGVKIEVDSVADIEFLAPVREYSDLNNSSAVVKMVYGDTSFLFTGDIEKAAETDILKSGADVSCDVLKVSHHGGDTSSQLKFIRAAKPEISVISVGEENAYNHPSGTIINRLKKEKSQIIRTDTSGDICIISDGKNVRRDEK